MIDTKSATLTSIWNLDIILNIMRFNLQTLYSYDVYKNYQPSLQQLVRQQVTSTILYARVQIFDFLIALKIFHSLYTQI